MLPKTSFTSLDPSRNKDQQIRHTADIIAYTAQLLSLEPGRTMGIKSRIRRRKNRLIPTSYSVVMNTRQITVTTKMTIKTAWIITSHNNPFQKLQLVTSVCNTSCSLDSGDRSELCATSTTNRQASPGERRHPKSGSSKGQPIQREKSHIQITAFQLIIGRSAAMFIKPLSGEDASQSQSKLFITINDLAVISLDNISSSSGD